MYPQGICRISIQEYYGCAAGAGAGEKALHFYTRLQFYYFQQINKDKLHNPRIALANLGGY